MRFAFTIGFRVFFTTLYIWRRFPPINLRYMSLRTTSRLVLTFASFMYENQPELIDTYFFHEYCFHFENKGQCLLIVYVFLVFLRKVIYVYISRSIYNVISRLQTTKIVKYAQVEEVVSMQPSFQISRRNLASSKFSGVKCQENLNKITTRNLI